jgi:hypothetical protein
MREENIQRVIGKERFDGLILRRVCTSSQTRWCGHIEYRRLVSRCIMKL